MTWLKRTLLGLVAVAAAALVVGGLVVGSYLNRLASDLPSEEKLVEMAAQAGACAPEDLVHAVIAAEDKEFLDLGEAAYLAAALRQPKRYNLVSDPISAKSRQQFVLREMVECGFANPAQAQAEMNAAIPVVARPSTQLDQPLGESRHPFGAPTP